MTNLLKFLIENYGYDEPIFINDIQKEIEIKSSTIRQAMKRLADRGKISKAGNGIYFIPNKNSILKNPILSVEKIVKKKYLSDNNNEVVGYKAGTNFANSIGLTTQTASVSTIITNNTSSIKREVTFYNKKIVLKKPRTIVNSSNYKILQVLDLLNDFDRLSEQPLEIAKYKISGYLEDVTVNETDFKTYLNAYPDKAKINAYESGVYNELTRK